MDERLLNKCGLCGAPDPAINGPRYMGNMECSGCRVRTDIMQFDLYCAACDQTYTTNVPHKTDLDKRDESLIGKIDELLDLQIKNHKQLLNEMRSRRI